MEKIHPTLSPSEEVAGQFFYHLPEHVGSGGFYINTFTSGLRLFYNNMQPKENIRIVTEANDWGFGIGFCPKGHCRTHNSTLQRTVDVEAGKSGHHFFPGNSVMTVDISPGPLVKINIAFDAEVLSDFAKDDEEAFLPFLQGFKD